MRVINKKVVSNNDLVEYLKKIHPVKFAPYIYWDKKNHLVHICFEDDDCYSDPIKGGDALESIQRAIGNNRIIGATLSFWGKELKFFKK